MNVMSELSKTISLASAKTAIFTGGITSSGVLEWINENSETVGALCAIASLIVMIIFKSIELFINYRQKKRERNNESQNKQGL